MTVKAEERGTRVAVSVQDTGIGIPENMQERVFDKFVRVPTKGREQRGTGLGLAISREIVRAHGERIWVDSEMGNGSTFTFTLERAE